MVGVVAYPAGWDASDVRRTCGTSAGRYELGECGLRWAYLLAVIGCLDAIILAALAFILATRHVRLQAEPGYTANGSLYKGKWQRWCAHRTQAVLFACAVSDDAVSNWTCSTEWRYARQNTYGTWRVHNEKFYGGITSCVPRCPLHVYQLRPELSTPNMTSCAPPLVRNCVSCIERCGCTKCPKVRRFLHSFIVLYIIQNLCSHTELLNDIYNTVVISC